MSFLKVLKEKNFYLFLGSGLIVSVAYMDPGNWGTNIEAGANFGYTLLWAIWLASGMAMLFQYLSGKLGIAGYSLPELIRIRFKSKTMVVAYWLLAEAAILATDLAEFLGIVVALNILFGIPMLIGAIIGVADVLLVIFLTQKRFRYLERAFISFVALIGLSFLYELIIVKPDYHQILVGSVVPAVSGQTVYLVVGIIGATIMPHALFVHSWLIKNKVIGDNFGSKSRILSYHLVDNVVSLLIAAVINAAMLIMAAAAFFGRAHVVTLFQAHQTLIPLFGNFAAFVFALALLSSGISSSVTGTLAGQSIMEGLTDFSLPLWVRRLITRFINLIPLTISILLGIEPLHVLVYSQVILSLLIPLPLIPIIWYTSKKEIMGELVNRKITTIFAILFGLIVVGFNAYLLASLVLH